MKKQYTVIDLFCGAGGFSEGFLQTKKYKFLAHIEWEMPMVETLRTNLIKRWNYSANMAKKTVIHFDIQKTQELINGNWSKETKKKYYDMNSKIISENGINGIIGKKKVDVVIGGPPCQAYSLAGRAQDPYSMKKDYRNFLFESFVRFVDYYKPKIFVFENVPGILSAKPGQKFVIDRIYEAFDKIGYNIRSPKKMKESIYSSSDFDVPQDRKRVIIFGVKKDSNINLEDLYCSLDSFKSKGPKKTVWNAIGNMPKFKPLAKTLTNGRNNISHELIGNIKIPLHTPRYHNSRDISIFKKWISNNMNKISNQEKLNFYKEVTGHSTNHNKYRNLEWDKPSPTIVAHLYKDGLMFIHPDITQLRSITIREAALLQTFPLDFDFVGTNEYCFKMIGNAVPVLFAKNIANAVYKVLES